MTMNDYNTAVARGVLAAIAALEAGTFTLGDAQAALQSAIPCFETDGSDIANAVRLAEADLEEIQFTLVLDEQLPAALVRLGALRNVIEDAANE